MKVALLLGGSFYPLHEGHIDLLSTARDHYLKLGHEVIDCLVCPSHFSSLSRKFPGMTLDFDNRLDTIAKVLQKYDWAAWSPPTMQGVKCYDEIIKSERNLGFSNVIANLRGEYAKNGIKLIQVSGTDSMIGFVRHDDNTIIVNDGRPVPPENREIVKKAKMIHSYPPKPPISSTIVRFLEKEKYYAPSVKDFDPSWLSDTGITLGKGVQGIVRLMLLGRQEVAVKIYHIENEHDKLLFENECLVLSSVNNSNTQISPKLYYCDIIENIGYIVTDVAVPLQKILPVSSQYKHQSANCESHDVEQYEIVKDYPCGKQDQTFLHTSAKMFDFCHDRIVKEYEKTNLFQKYLAITDLIRKNKDLFKLQVIRGLQTCLDKLEKSQIIHRDLYYDNIVVDIINNQICTQVIDYGVAKKINSPIHIRRGALRYYPIVSLNHPEHYTFACDKYMSTFIVYELLMEHEIYPECEGDTRKISKKRKKKDFPVWDKPVSECFNDIVESVKIIWQEN
jgi:serine/threonine protein kinase